MLFFYPVIVFAEFWRTYTWSLILHYKTISFKNSFLIALAYVLGNILTADKAYVPQQLTLPIYLTIVFKLKGLWNTQSVSENSVYFQNIYFSMLYCWNLENASMQHSQIKTFFLCQYALPVYFCSRHCIAKFNILLLKKCFNF